MRWLVRVSSEFPRATLVGVLLVTLLAVAGLVDPWTGEPRLLVDPSFEKLLPADDPGRQALDDLQRRFEAGERFLVAVEPEGGAFHRDALEATERLANKLLSLEEVQSVHSLATAPWPFESEGGVLAQTVVDAVREAPDPVAAVAATRRALLADPLVPGVLVSRDGAVTALHVAVAPMPEAQLLESDLGRRFAALAREEFGQVPVWVTGAPFLKAEMNRILNGELVSQVPLVLAIMMVVSFLVFRTRTGAWLPVATILLALLWTLGAMGWAGYAVNIVTSIVPPLILVVGFAYTVHVVAEAQALARPDARREGLRGLEGIAVPVVLTGVTTAIGFLSLGVSDHPAIREFGAFGAAGVLASLFAALSFAPAVLALWPGVAPRSLELRERRLDLAFERLAELAVRQRVVVLSVAGVVLAGSLWGASRIHVDTRIVDNFRSDSMVRASYERLNSVLDGSDQLYVLLEGEEPGVLLEPASLREVAAVQRWLVSQPEVGGATSIVDHLEAARRALGARSPLESGATRSLVAQLLWLGDGEALDPILDHARKGTVVWVRSRATSSREIAALVERIEAHLANREGRLEGSVSGGSVLLTRAVDDVSRDQARSLGVAFAVVFAVLVVAFRSVRASLWTLVPNALPVAGYFGLLGFSGVPLNNATALLGCVVLGIAIDDTLHFISRHRDAVTAGASPAAASRQALGHVGRPVTWTTAALCLGLLVLTTSELTTQAQFGALGAATLLFAWAVDLLVTPALCSLIRWRGLARPVSGRAESAREDPSVAPVSWGALTLGANHPGRGRDVVEQTLGSGPQ